MLVMDSAQASGSPSADKAGLCSFFTFPAMTSMNQSAGFLRLKGGEGFLVYPTVLNKKTREVGGKRTKESVAPRWSKPSTVYLCFFHAVCTEMFSREQLDKISRPLL